MSVETESARQQDALELQRMPIEFIGQSVRLQRVLDNDADYVDPEDMLSALCEDNKILRARLREAHNACDQHRVLSPSVRSKAGLTIQSGGPGVSSKRAAV